MREIRTYGSEGGGAERFFLPLLLSPARKRWGRVRKTHKPEQRGDTDAGRSTKNVEMASDACRFDGLANASVGMGIAVAGFLFKAHE